MQNEQMLTSLVQKVIEEIRAGNAFAAQTAENTRLTVENTHATATHTKDIRRDVTAIRLGKTGTKHSLQEDPLKPVQREEVEEAKLRIREQRKTNPHVSRLGICTQVLREWRQRGIKGGYTDKFALNNRVTTELNREDASLPPF